MSYTQLSGDLENWGFSIVVISLGMLSLAMICIPLYKRKTMPKGFQIICYLIALPAGLFSIANYINDNVINFFEPSLVYFLLTFAPSMSYLWYKINQEEKNENT